MSQHPHAPAERVFRSNPAVAVIGGLVFGAIAAVLALAIIPQILPDTVYSNTRQVIVYSAMAVLFVGIFLLMIWSGRVRVTVTADSVEIARVGKSTVYPRATTAFRTKITEHRTNGVRTNTTRALVAHTGGGEKLIALPGFNREKFSELAAAITPLDLPPAADPVEAARMRANVPTSFTVDASRERSRATRNLVIAAIALVVGIIGVVLAFSPGFFDGDSAVLVLLIPVGVIAAAGFGASGLRGRRAARSAPSTITVSGLGIRIDDVDHPFAQANRIRVSPPSYPERRIVVDAATGRSIHLVSAQRVLIAPEYEALIASLQVHLAERPGLLAFDLA